MAFCMNCGQKIPDGGKFCSNCGVAVNSAGSTQRETVYDGEIHKCPNCGEILSAFVVACPSCGYELRGGRASSTVREFANRLTDTQDRVKKVTLIQSFPIPNNKEDILEFMILASTCFDATEKTKENNAEKDISDAWLMKVEQSYQKAKLLFYNDDDFSKIQNVYEQTYNKIKISTDIAKKKIMSNFF